MIVMRRIISWGRFGLVRLGIRLMLPRIVRRWMLWLLILGFDVIPCMGGEHLYRLIDIIYHGVYAAYIEYNGKVLYFAYSLDSSYAALVFPASVQIGVSLDKMTLFRAFPEEDKRMTGA